MTPDFDIYEHRTIDLLNCTACACRAEATQVVPPSFNKDKNLSIMVLGRNPGRDEDKEGKPFVGRGGQVLTEMLDRIGLEREDVFITNTLKCYTTNDRPPKWDEALTCAKWLYWEIAWLKPKLIVTLGNDATRILCGKSFQSVTYTHGQTVWHDKFKALLFLEHHPGTMLRKPTLMNDVFMNDLPRLKELVNLVKQGIDLRGVGQ